MVVSSSNLCHCWQLEVNFLSFLRWPDDLTVTLYVCLLLRGGMPHHFSPTSLSLKRICRHWLWKIKGGYFLTPSVTWIPFFHRLLSTPVGELLRSQPVQLQKAAALQEIQHAVNSSSDPQIPVVDSNGMPAKLFLYSTPQVKYPYFLLNADYWKKKTSGC